MIISVMMDPDNPNDMKRWDRFRDGDDLALSAIYSDNVVSLYQYGLKFTVNRDLIEDTIHDLFLDLIRNRETIGDTDNIQFYLFKSFRRKLFRRLKKELRYTDNLLSDMMFDISYSVEQEIISGEQRDNTSRSVLNAIEKLSPRQKEAIYLRFNKELDYNEISGILGMGIEASRNLVYRAIKSLKESILKAGGGSVLLFILKKITSSLKKIQFQ
jgi:RNA polymerase sigma factor (sigma-70 family)